MGKKLLIISHEASLTGAPLFLLNLIKSLNKDSDYQFYFLFKKSGELIFEFENYGNVLAVDNLNNTKSPLVKTLIRLLPLYRIRDILFKLKISFFKPDLTISNTIANSTILKYINLEKTKLVTIVHEMKGVISLYDTLKLNDSNKILKSSDKIIAVSKSVKKDLIDKFGAPKYKIEVIYNSSKYFKKRTIDQQEILSWKSKNRIPLDATLVGTCGGPIWRKGPDVFFNVVKAFLQKYPKKNIFFIWQGGIKNSSQFLDFKSEIHLLDLEKYITIIPQTKNIHCFYYAIDILISTAREEPFGLTILEAGTYSKPCIAFKKSGGPEELLKQNRGILVKYGDFCQAADEINRLNNDKTLYNKYASTLNEFVVKHNSQINFLKYKKIIDRFIE